MGRIKIIFILLLVWTGCQDNNSEIFDGNRYVNSISEANYIWANQVKREYAIGVFNLEDSVFYYDVIQKNEIYEKAYKLMWSEYRKTEEGGIRETQVSFNKFLRTMKGLKYCNEKFLVEDLFEDVDREIPKEENAFCREIVKQKILIAFERKKHGLILCPPSTSPNDK